METSLPVAMVALGLTVGGVSPVMAAAGDVTITVRSGGIRTAEKNVGKGVPGTVFTATTTDTKGPELSESCTVDANSACVITVPRGRKWKIRETAPASGWYTNTAIGKGSKDTVDSFPYVFFTSADGIYAEVNSNITLPQGANGRARDPPLRQWE